MPPYDDLVPALKAYYEAHGIGAARFSCPHSEECSRNSPHFTPAIEPHLGRRFGDGIPRLVFVSLDSGSLDGDRGIERSEAASSWRLAGRDKIKHWYRTCELAQRILSAFDSSISGIRTEAVASYFAHLNSARCCQNKKGRAQADPILFTNCREYLGPELEIFRPDILITQGRYAETAVRHHFAPVRTTPAPWDTADSYHVLEIGGSQCLFYHTHHPRYARGFNRQRKLAILPDDGLRAVALTHIRGPQS